MSLPPNARLLAVALLGGLLTSPGLLRCADLDQTFAVIPTEIQKAGVDYGGDAFDDATIAAANEFSWRSFIALNWPATDWPTKPERGVADKGKDFSDLTGPRVWET